MQHGLCVQEHFYFHAACLVQSLSPSVRPIAAHSLGRQASAPQTAGTHVPTVASDYDQHFHMMTPVKGRQEGELPNTDNSMRDLSHYHLQVSFSKLTASVSSQTSASVLHKHHSNIHTVSGSSHKSSGYRTYSP